MTRIEEGIKLDFDDVVIKPNRSTSPSRKHIVLDRSFKFYHSKKEWDGFPLMVANLDTTGSYQMAEEMRKHKTITCLNKHYRNQTSYFQDESASKRDYTWYSLGISEHEFHLLYDLIEKVGFCPHICLDVANGYTAYFVSKLQELRSELPDAVIMAGNVTTPEMTQELILAGADIIKIGIGPGALCKTRVQTGVGYGQLSAIIECANAAHGLKSGEKRMGLICADGGCKNPGDICKAFGAGADFVMCGSLFGGTDECQGEWEYEYLTIARYGYPDSVTIESWDTWISEESKLKLAADCKRKKTLLMYGMSSKEAQNKYHGGLPEYRASEGRAVKVPYKGFAKDTLLEIQGGLRSCCTYTGAICLKDLPKCTTFVRVTNTHTRTFENESV